LTAVLTRFTFWSVALDQKKRECILVAAARAFSRFGFKKTSVDEIARDAGVAKGTIYMAADTKEDLFYQVVHREVRAWIAEGARLVDPRIPAEQLLVQVAMAGYAYLQQRPLVRDLLLQQHHLIMPEWASRLEELRQLGQSTSVEILAIGVRQGRFRPDLDLVEVARLLQDLSLTTHLFHATITPEALQRRLVTAMDLILNGLHATSEAGLVVPKIELPASRPVVAARPD